MERWKRFSWGGAVLVTFAVSGSRIMGCGGSNNPQSELVGGAGGATGSVPPLAPPRTVFAAHYGDEGEQALAGLAVDGAGNIYVAGNESPQNIATTGPSSEPLPTQGTAKGVFLLQYSPTGQLRWRQPFAPGPDTFDLQVTGVAVQATTGVEILVGQIGGSVTIGGKTLSSGVDPRSGVQVTNLWLTAVDSAGYLVWTKLIPSPGYVFPDQVFVTSSGDIEVTGALADNATVGGAPLANGGFGASFVARFSPTGDPIWSHPVTGFFRPVKSGADADGGLVLGGIAQGPFEYQGESFSNGGGPFEISNAVVLRLDPQGNKRWIQAYINNAGFSMAGATVDRSQNVVIHGQFNGPFDMGGGHVFTGPATTSGTMDGVIAKLAPDDGATLWANQIPGGLGQQFGASVATNAAGDIALMNNGDGFTAGPSFGGVSPLPPASIGHYIVKLAADGKFLWTLGFPTASGLGPPRSGLAFVDPSGQLAAAGNFDNTVDFGTGPLTVPGQLVRNGSGPEWVADDVFTVLLAP